MTREPFSLLADNILNMTLSDLLSVGQTVLHAGCRILGRAGDCLNACVGVICSSGIAHGWTDREQL